MNTSGPNPWFWAQNDRFGPDVVTFGVVNPSQKNQVKMIQNNTKLPHLAQTQVLGPMWLSFLVVLDGLTLTLIGFLKFLGPPGPKEAKMGSQFCS